MLQVHTPATQNPPMSKPLHVMDWHAHVELDVHATVLRLHTRLASACASPDVPSIAELPVQPTMLHDLVLAAAVAGPIATE